MEEAKASLPGLEVIVLDSESAAGGQGLIALEAWRAARGGAELDEVVGEADRARNLARMADLESALAEKIETTHAGWGQKYVDRVHKKGKWTTWERFDALVDPGSEVFEVGTLVNWGRAHADPAPPWPKRMERR